MGRRTLVATLVTLLVAPHGADAQQARSSSRLGFLSSSSSERDKPRLTAFLEGLRELGYLEGKTIFIEQRYAGGRFEILPELAAELVRLKVDILVVSGAPASNAAKNATSVIPIVMTDVSDPVGIGLVTSCRGQAETSPGCRTSTPAWWPNGSNSSRSCSPRHPAWLFY